MESATAFHIAGIIEFCYISIFCQTSPGSRAGMVFLVPQQGWMPARFLVSRAWRNVQAGVLDCSFDGFLGKTPSVDEPLLFHEPWGLTARFGESSFGRQRDRLRGRRGDAPRIQLTLTCSMLHIVCWVFKRPCRGILHSAQSPCVKEVLVDCVPIQEYSRVDRPDMARPNNDAMKLEAWRSSFPWKPWTWRETRYEGKVFEKGLGRCRCGGPHLSWTNGCTETRGRVEYVFWKD
jgi:hypothetical protein